MASLLALCAMFVSFTAAVLEPCQGFWMCCMAQTALLQHDFMTHSL